MNSPTQMQNANADFGQRSRLALTHPVTLAALGVLLLNDLVFKSLWVNPWTTGKLSDLAWVVFASPLLAFLLSLAARNHRRAQRAAFMAAYVGLPLLYAAFKTFAPVHDAIIWGLSLLSGGAAGSPLDPTDSLVIPVGLAIALWVWRRGGDSGNGGGTGTLRQRVVLLAAALATVASIASSSERPHFEGVELSRATDSSASEGIIFAVSDDSRVYESSDGGLSWQTNSKKPERFDDSNRQRVDTPRGRFEIRESGIVRVSNDGSASVIYSTKHLKSDGSKWFQTKTEPHFFPDQINTTPSDIVYDPRSDNVIVRMGIQGVVVGTPDGEWTPVAVGSYRPIDFSLGAKIQALMGIFWTIVITLVPAVMIPVVALAGTLNGRNLGLPLTGARRVIGFIAMLFNISALLCALGILMPFDRFTDSFLQLHLIFLAAVAIISSIISVGLYSYVFSGPFSVLSGLPSAHGRAIIIATLAMVAAIFLMLIIWVQTDVSTVFAAAGILILLAATGVSLVRYLTGRSPLTW